MSAFSKSELLGMGADEVLGQMPAAVVVVDAASQQVVYANDRARQMTAQLDRRVPGEISDDWVIFHPDGREYDVGEWPLVRSITTGEEVGDEEYFHVRPDGTRLFVRCSSAPIYDGDRQIVAGVLVMADVTEEKAHEERLRYLAGLLDNTEDAIVALDERWRITVWNTGAERMYGWTASEARGRSTFDVARFQMGYEERAEVRRTVTEHGRWRGEVVAFRKDGTPMYAELIKVALRDGAGEIIGYLGIHRDVSDRKQAEDALHEEQRRATTILESISDIFLAVDREWRLTYVNERALARAGLAWGRKAEAGELLGRSVWELFPQLLGTRIEHELKRALRGETTVEFEAYSAPTDTWVEARVYPSRDGLSIYMRDVSARKWANAEISRRAEQQALVAELGQRALASEDLQTLLDDSVGLVARTLDVELVAVAELRPAGEPPTWRAGFGWPAGTAGHPIAADVLARYTAQRGRPVVIDDVGTEARTEVGALAREYGVASGVSVLISGPGEPFGTLAALSTRRRSFARAEVSFLQSVANVLASAVDRNRGDERVLEVREAERRRIARDLHDNALQDLSHALELAGGRKKMTAALTRVGEHLREAIHDLRLGAEQETPFAQALESLVTVHRGTVPPQAIDLDLGAGVPAESLRAAGVEILRIVGEALTNARRHAGARRVRVRARGADGWLRVQVSDNGRGFDSGQPSSGGHGMTAMRERAELLNGRLEVFSEPGTGTTVRLEVPLRPAGPRATDGVRVLLVDDHPAVRQAVAAMFERETGFVVAGQAGSLAEARELLHGVDVAVLDLRLPDGDGADLIAELREASPGVQVLVLSADLDRARAARAIAAGAAGALDKTADLHQVVDAVQRLRAGQALLADDEVADLLRLAGRRRERERRDEEALGSLTPREREVLRALAVGLDTQAIADRFDITVRTARNHVARIRAKLGVHTQLQAVLVALRQGLADGP